MADAANDFDILGVLGGLPPALQGIFVLGVGASVGVLLYRRFAARLNLTGPDPKVLAVGDPTTFTDMGPVRDLIKQIDLMSLQMMKNEVQLGGVITAFEEHTKQMSQLVDLIGDFFSDMKIEREKKADEEAKKQNYSEGYQQAMVDHQKVSRPRRRAPSQKTAATHKQK